MADLGFFGGGSDSSDSEEETVQESKSEKKFLVPVAKKVEKTEERSKSALPAPEEILLVRQRSSFFNDDQNGVNWNNDSLLREAPRPPTPDPADAWKAWKTQLVPENTKVDDSDQIYFQDGQKASSMKGKMKRPDNVQDMAMGWSKQYGDGSAPSYATETRMEERINPADEAKIKMPRKREAEATKQMPDGAKGPKFTKKQMEKEVNKRSAAQFGNLTDY